MEAACPAVLNEHLVAEHLETRATEVLRRLPAEKERCRRNVVRQRTRRRACV